ncbi:reverse transcriptase domain-containing protein [Tanacetum coccineum]
MPPWKAPRTRTTPATTTTTPVTSVQLKVLIDRGITDALAARDATRNGDDSHTSGTGTRRTERVARECTYQDFMKYQPLYFKGTEGVFATCTLLRIALMWWNSHVRTVCHDVAYAMTWTDLKKKMTNKYCPRGEIKKLEVKMFPEESDKIKKYVDGLPDMIHRSVMASKPKTMQDAIEFATELMDKKISTLAKPIAYTAGSGERKEYARALPLCSKCKFHHDGPCTVKCANCKKVGHLTRDCWNPTATNNQRNLTCYECGNQGYYRSDCPELKNKNYGNQAGGTRAHGVVYALGGG